MILHCSSGKENWYLMQVFTSLKDSKQTVEGGGGKISYTSLYPYIFQHKKLEALKSLSTPPSLRLPAKSITVPLPLPSRFPQLPKSELSMIGSSFRKTRGNKKKKGGKPRDAKQIPHQKTQADLDREESILDGLFGGYDGERRIEP